MAKKSKADDFEEVLRPELIQAIEALRAAAYEFGKLAADTLDDDYSALECKTLLALMDLKDFCKEREET